jgi:hypothetical protein
LIVGTLVWHRFPVFLYSKFYECTELVLNVCHPYGFVKPNKPSLGNSSS